MATKDDSPGLLSKVARFVRNPTKDWSTLDQPEATPDSEHGKQALKEVIERKRRNDFVRRREFDYLRKLRRDGLLVGPNQTGHPYFFQSSTVFNNDDRASTIKKIDEIEAQMSEQWWSEHDKEVPTQPTGQKPAPASARLKWDADSVDAPAEANVALVSHEAAEARSVLGSTQAGNYESTQIAPPSVADLAPTRGLPRKAAPVQVAAQIADLGNSEFSSSKLFTEELGESLADPDLEEAAVRFANGDDAGAEAGLLAALQGSDVTTETAARWALALFDLYRATGQRSRFDTLAINYARRFGGAAPAWFSTPELLQEAAHVAAQVEDKGPQRGARATWDCPAVLDAAAVQALQARLAQTQTPWVLDWSGLRGVAPDAGKALAQLFAQWCALPVKLHFAAPQVLGGILKGCTPQGDRTVDSSWWRLRLDLLRILRQQQAFEEVALDFCATYQVSPPAWSAAAGEYLDEESMAPVVPEETQGPPSAQATGARLDLEGEQLANAGSDQRPAAEAELTGEVLGDAQEALDKFQDDMKRTDHLVISCARLIRVDFSAAGSILNWVAARESQACRIEFRNVPCLVAAFFNVIGINEHVQVGARTG